MLGLLLRCFSSFLLREGKACSVKNLNQDTYNMEQQLHDAATLSTCNALHHQVKECQVH